MKLLVSALEPSSNIHLREVLKYGKDIELIGIFDSTLGKSTYLDTNLQWAVNWVFGRIVDLRKI